jgi:type II secretion system protein J
MRRSRGFTLLEIMLTMAITATFLAMIGAVLISVLNTIDNVENQVRTEKAGYGILTTLRRDLAGVYAYALGGLAFEGKNETALGRDANQLHFVTTADVMESEDGTTPRLIEVGYKLNPAEEGDLLVLYRRAVPYSGDPLDADEDYVELYGAVHSLKMEYLDPESKEWKEKWDDPTLLPRAVKLTLELALDEAQRMAAEQGQDIPAPKYELIVGITAAAQPASAEGDGDATPPGG